MHLLLLEMSVVAIALLQSAATPQESLLDAPPTCRQIAESIGTDTDAGAVLKIVLAHAMAQSHREFLLASQIPDDWLPRMAGVEFVRLSEADAVKHLAACGEYWVVDRCGVLATRSPCS